jgi:hypothetical protein
LLSILHSSGHYFSGKPPKSISLAISHVFENPGNSPSSQQ